MFLRSLMICCYLDGSLLGFLSLSIDEDGLLPNAGGI